jgi:hypothetical protein
MYTISFTFCIFEQHGYFLYDCFNKMLLLYVTVMLRLAASTLPAYNFGRITPAHTDYIYGCIHTHYVSISTAVPRMLQPPLFLLYVQLVYIRPPIVLAVRSTPKWASLKLFIRPSKFTSILF